MSYKERVAEAVAVLEEHNSVPGVAMVSVDKFRSELRRIGATSEASLAYCSAKDLVKECGLPSVLAGRLVALFGALVGPYRLKKQIAEGGFGRTYLGEHIVTGMPVCIKQCGEASAEDERIIINEAKAMWDLRHFAIPTVRDLVRLEDGTLALVMSYIEGPTLRQIVEKVGALEAEHVAWITERVLNTLKYLHFNGVVHGDVKPQNIIVQPKDHTVVLVDYGLAMVKPDRHARSLGFTDYFAPPEQKAGGPLVPESDFYSLGATMLYMLTGDLDLVEQKRVPEDTPDPLCQFIRRLMVRDVTNRPRWEKEDLFETIQKVREESFGRRRSEMAPIPGLTD